MKALEHQSHTSKLASLYPYIKGLPGRGNLTSQAVLAAAAATAASSLAAGINPLWVAPFLFSVLLLNFLAVRLDGWRGLLSLRRLNGLMMIEMGVAAAGAAFSLLIYVFSGRVGVSAAVFAGALALTSTLRGSVLRALSGDRAEFSLAFTSLSSALQALPFILFSPYTQFRLGAALGHLTGALFFLASTCLIDRVFKVMGLKPLKLLSAMLAIFLDGRKEWLEELAEKLNTSADIRVEVLVFRESRAGKPGLALIVPDFHPGPFRDFGSSVLPYLIDGRLRELGVKSVIVRGLSGHSRNIISRRDCEKIAEKVAEAVEGCVSGYLELGGRAETLTQGTGRALIIPVGDALLTILTLHPRGMEDIPPDILRGVENSGLIVVDAHNSFSENVRDLDGDGLKDLEGLARLASEVRVERVPELVAGYGEAPVPGYGLEDGVGPMGVRALLLGPRGRLTALVVMDGNNALPEVRDKVLERLGGLGVRAAEVLTTDTHLVNGMKLGGRGYHPLGEVVDAETLARAAEEAVRRALESARRMEVSRLTLVFPHVKVMSDEFLEEASRRAFASLKLFFLFLAASPATAFLATILLL